MLDPDERRRIGSELKHFLAVNDIDRELFATTCGLGKSTIDKMVTGIFSERTLHKVVERSDFRLKTTYASKMIGGYSKKSWSGYISKFIYIHPSIENDRNVIASPSEIYWDEKLTGLALRINDRFMGALWIPHERSPLIYIQPVNDIGVRFIVSTMVGEACMRGLVLRVDNIMAAAYVPVTLPVVLKRMASDDVLKQNAFGVIEPEHDLYESYSNEIRRVVSKQFGKMITWPPKVEG